MESDRGYAVRHAGDILVQNIHGFAISDGFEVFGGTGAALTALVLVIAAVMIWYSKGAKDKGWIS